MHELVDEEKWDDLVETIPTKVHIGKSSSGWMFLFNTNDGEYYSKDRCNIEEFLQSAGTIVDEYGREYTNMEFWEMVDAKADGFYDKTYRDAERSEQIKYSSILWEAETIHDGLRFSAYTTFG